MGFPWEGKMHRVMGINSMEEKENLNNLYNCDSNLGWWNSSGVVYPDGQRQTIPYAEIKETDPVMPKTKYCNCEEPTPKNDKANGKRYQVCTTCKKETSSLYFQLDEAPQNFHAFDIIEVNNPDTEEPTPLRGTVLSVNNDNGRKLATIKLTQSGQEIKVDCKYARKVGYDDIYVQEKNLENFRELFGDSPYFSIFDWDKE